MSRVMQIMFIALCAAVLWKTGREAILMVELKHERSALQQMTEQRDAWQQSAEQAAREQERAERQRRDAEAAVQALQEELAEQAKGYDALRQRIRRAPASDDGSVAPVLRDTLERLP